MTKDYYEEDIKAIASFENSGNLSDEDYSKYIREIISGSNIQ